MSGQLADSGLIRPFGPDTPRMSPSYTAPGNDVAVGSAMTAVGLPGSWMLRVALFRAPNLTVGVAPDENDTLPDATCTVSGTGSAPLSSDAAKNDV